MSARRPIVAIDGPAGVGKSTAARRVAQELGFTLVDTGALYRAVAWAARSRQVSWDDEPALAELTRSLEISLDQDEASGRTAVAVGGRDCSTAIRSPEISLGASAVSRHPEVREALLGLQRALGVAGGVVLEGRDIGTVVFPEAEVKVFLTAAAEVRARRRYDELREKGEAVDFDETLADVERRDHQDSTRAVAPLRPAEDAVIVDSSRLTIDAVIARIVALVQGASRRNSL